MNNPSRRYRGILFGFSICFLLVISSGNSASARILTIGVITHVAIHDPAIDGFKQGMTELGYIEGKDVRYIYNGLVEGIPEKIDAEIKNLLARGVDQFLTAGNLVTTRVKMATEGSDIPVLFVAGSQPVEDGHVESLGRPGGNVTGTRVPFTSAKTLEFLLEVSPEITKIFLPFNPDDVVSLIVIDGLKEKLPQLGIELVYSEVTGIENARAAIETLPDDIDAILRIASPTLDSRNSELSQAAIRRGLPLVAGLPLDEAVFLTCAADFFTSGKQVARMTHVIHHGADPGELPVETTDPFLTINLDTAGKIGVYVPDGVLVQAKTIIRR